MELNAAIKQLRGAESQQVFATRMGISISALQNYERESKPRRPTLPLLLKLTDEARSSRRPGLASMFWRAFLQDTGLSRKWVYFYAFKEQPGELPHYYFFSYTPPDADQRERAAVWAFSDALLEIHSTDPETKERALQKLAAATKALTDDGAKREKGRQG